MTTEKLTCLINESDCGREAGNPVCSMCGMDERVMYPGQEDLNAAIVAAEFHYKHVRETEELERRKAEEAKRRAEKERKEAENRRERGRQEKEKKSAQEREEIERRKAEEAKRQADKERKEAENRREREKQEKERKAAVDTARRLLKDQYYQERARVGRFNNIWVGLVAGPLFIVFLLLVVETGFNIFAVIILCGICYATYLNWDFKLVKLESEALYNHLVEKPDVLRDDLDKSFISFYCAANCMNQELHSRIKKIIAEKLGVNILCVTGDKSFIGDFKAEALDVVELIMALENEFDIELSDNEAEKISTVQQAINCMAGRVKP